MEESTSGLEGDRNAKHNVYRIGGIAVDFPHKAYGSQLAFMGRVIATLDRAQKQGRCHALLESPTGTGKTLSLLCSVLSWQKNFSPRYSKPAFKESDPFLDGGGFVPEPESSQKKAVNQEKRPPRIYYTSRTHTQITQVINEYRKTAYRVPMAVLASRKHYCTNPVVCKSEDVNENCKKLLKDERMGCAEFKNANRVKDHPSIKRGGSHEVHDIEDLAKIGRSVRGCSYYGARSLATEAQLVFCPYNYVINPIIRKAMEVDLKGSILVLDEAHNIEDMAREAGSIDIDEEALHRLQHELGILCYGHSGNSSTYQPLHDMVQGIISWIAQRTDDLGYHDFEHYSSCWTGDSCVRELAEAGICPQSFPVLEGFAKKAIKDYSEGAPEQMCLSGMSATILEGLFCSLSYFFSGGCQYATDFQLVLQRVGKQQGNKSKSWAHTLSLWCMNPGIVFREMANLSLSVILTSGTLSPMSSFSSELGVEFEVCMEAPHVIDIGSQLYASVLSKGPQNHRLNASFKTSEGYTFQDELGSSLEEIFKVVPGGVLVFFPSYKFLEKLQARWQQTGKWSQLNALKRLFIEPRGNAGDFDRILKAYFNSVRFAKTNGPGKMNDTRKGTLKRFRGIQSKNSNKRQGGALLAVCRGKVSEGVNFSDEDARAVVIVGIPFPSINDLQVALKKKYNDSFKSSKNLLSGSTWYCHQAFRALNQAAGRCIRHRSDYGAVIFLDERFEEERNRAYISKWIGNSLKQTESFHLMLEELMSFFSNAKESYPSERIKVMPPNLLKYGNIVPNARQRKLISDKAKQHQRLQAADPLFSPKLNDDHLGMMSANSVSHDSPNSSFRYKSPADLEEISNIVGYNREHKHESLSVDPQIHKRNFPGLQPSDCSRSFSFDSASVSSDSPNSSFHYKSPADLEETSNIVGYNREHKHESLSVDSQINKRKFQGLQPSDCIRSFSFDSASVYCDSPNLSFHYESPADLEEKSNIVGYNREHKHESLSVDSRIHQRKFPGLQPSDCSRSFSFDSASVSRDSPNSSFHYKSPADLEEISNIVGYDREHKHESLSVDSRIHKRKFSGLQPSDCSRSFSFDSASDAKVDDDNPVVDTCRKLKSKETLQIKEDEDLIKRLSTSTELKPQKLHLCCHLCKNSLGLSESRFLVPCSVAPFSKPCLPPFLKNTLSRMNSPESILAKNEIVIVNVWNVDPRVFDRRSCKENLLIQEGGCVIRPVDCPFCCTTSATCLGVQILAADATTAHLLNKVLFFRERLLIKGDLVSPENEELVEIDRQTFVEESKSPPSQSRSKSKLRLPRAGRD